MALATNHIIIANCIKKTNNSPCPTYTSISKLSLLQGRSVVICHGHISMAAKISSFSDFGDNYRYLSYKYGIGIHVWHLPLCKLYKCFDVFLLNHHKTIANGVFIRDLCLLRENNIVDDDQDLTSTELTYMIDFLCTS